MKVHTTDIVDEPQHDQPEHPDSDSGHSDLTEPDLDTPEDSILDFVNSQCSH